MSLATLVKQLGLEKPSEKLEAVSATVDPDLSQVFFPALRQSVKDGTLTLAKIDYFLSQFPQIHPGIKEFLLSRKAWLLLCQGDGAAALLQYEEALTFNPQSAKTWTSKGAALLELDRPDEAFQAFQQAYLLKENFGPQMQGYLKDLLQGWSTAAALRGVFGISRQDSRELQKGVEEYLGVLEKARAENLGDAATVYLKAEEPASVELQEVIEEWELAVRLLSIKDPFEGWRALAKEISKVWPQGVSAVDAIREQRE